MDRLLQYCSKETGYEKQEVETIIACFLDKVSQELSKGHIVDLGACFDVLSMELRSGMLPGGSAMEKTEMTMAGLLEILAFRTGCMYLSDLHQPELLPATKRALHSIFPQQFSLWEWQDAVAYITGEQSSFESPEQAADYLKKYPVRQETGGTLANYK